MSDPKKILSSKYLPQNRFQNFGQAIVSAKIRGFRGISTDIDFEYPVTALSGFNGSGKSTIGQLMLCGYKYLQNQPAQKRFYVANFFPVSAADPEPFTADAAVTFRYQTERADVLQELTVARSVKEWSGYKRQPSKNTEYIGFTVYIPKVERRDMSIYSAKNLLLTERSASSNAKTYVSRILGSEYQDVYFQGVSARSKQSELGMAKRFGHIYSENNMGFGEGRVVYTVRLLESCPEKSLIVLEEPETSLHENAQYELAKYLIDVSSRRGHQIIFSTHSSHMMNALPAEGRKLLVRSGTGVQVFDRVSSSRIKTALSAGANGHTIVCVEDNFAQSKLREILRQHSLPLLSSVSIVPFGDAKAVLSAQSALVQSGFRAIAVRDADMPENRAQNQFRLPGRLPPEKEVFHTPAVTQMLLNNYGIDFGALMAANPDLDHHKYAEVCCEKAQVSREVLESDCIRVFLNHQEPDWSRELCQLISAAA